MCFPQYPDWLPALIHPTRCNNFDLMNLEASEYLTRNWASTPINFDFWGMINNVARNVDISMRNNYCCGGGIFNTYYANGFGGGGYFSGDYFTRTSSPSTSEKKSPEKEKLDNLKGVLDDFLNKSSETDLDDSYKEGIKADIDSIMNNTDYTDAKKYEEIQRVYEQIKNNTAFKDYLTRWRKFKVLGKSQTFEMYMGDLSVADTNITKNLITMVSNLNNSQGDTSALSSIREENVLPLINSLNTGTESFAKKLEDKINTINDENSKETALSNIHCMTGALIDLATKVENRLANPDIITTRIKALNKAVESTSNELAFAEAFDELYAVTKTAMVKIIEEEFIDNCKDILYKDIQNKDTLDKDFVNELIGAKISDALSGIDQGLIDGIKIKGKAQYEPIQGDNKESIDNKTGEEILSELTENGALESINKKVDGKDIYKAANNELYVLGDDKLFYKVTVKTDTNGQKTYSVDFDTTGLNASKIKKIKTDSDNKEDEKERRQGIIDTINNESEEVYHLTKIGDDAEFTGTGKNGTTVDESYTVYKGTDNKYYILNDDGKLVEVEKKNQDYKVKTDATAITYDSWKQNMKNAQNKAVDDLENPLKNNNITLNDDLRTIGGRKPSKWLRRKKWQKGFSKDLDNALGAYNTVPDDFVNKEAWNNAVKKLKEYYNNEYRKLANVTQSLDDENTFDGDRSLPRWMRRRFKTYRMSEGYGRRQNYNVKISGLIKKDKESKASSYYICNNSDDLTYKNVVTDNANKSETGLYIGCDYDGGWSLFGQRSEFRFFLDGNTVFEKFKEFLKEELK